ncbi:penicillin acylase family protein [Luteimonas dalianensis]|uniref:penicillin acylase family protein n=1 Tax=Luteimonas dalianensis TaxID=1148196 RepID=UPI003BF2E578
MRKWLPRVVLLIAALLLLALLAAWLLLRASLPALDGEHALAGLGAPVQVERDALGVATISAASAADAARALGYVHAQERWFEMDLMRRSSAGELAALFGELALDADRERRRHRLRARIRERLPEIAGERMGELAAYAEGANAGLAALGSRPWAYQLLRAQPEPWTPEDSILAAYAMYFDLQGGRNEHELRRWKAAAHLPPALRDLLAHDGSDWDAPLMGEARGDAVLPGPEAVDLRRLPFPGTDAPVALSDTGTPGSNNFAVAGALTADGRAIVANDMHLGLRAPNVWFRARLRYSEAGAPGGRVDVSGFTLPGVPAVIVGSNGHVAWGFTNSYGDYMDWRIETPCADGVAADGCEPAIRHVEHIEVAGGEDIAFEILETGWGPVVEWLDDGRALALRWVAHLPGSLNLELAGLAAAGDLDEALAAADRTAVPTQNLMTGDRHGRIAWRLLGPLAERDPGCHQLPVAGMEPAADGLGERDCSPWTIATDRSPIVVDPAEDRLWTANSRVVGSAAEALVGDGGYAFGARQQQIRDLLFASDSFTEQDLLDLQLDARAVLLDRWWHLLDGLPPRDDAPALLELAAAASDWSGRADTGSVGYRIVRAWRLAVHARIADGLTGPAQVALGDDFAMPDLPQLEGVAWPLVTRQPAHLLSPRFDDWHGLFEDAAREVRDALAASGPLAERSWGERNTTRICHPLADAVPLLGRRLCMPAEPLPGDGMMPRVQGPSFGASQRMVVAPGHEADGIAHMPGGQSGHPLSPFWGAGHADWARGDASPFLPGPAEYRMTLISPPPP